MKFTEIRKLIFDSLSDGPGSGEASRRLQEGISFDFSNSFTDKVIDRIFASDIMVARQIEFSRYLNLAFSRIAITGIAAIVLLLLSIFLMEGDLSFNSILGIGDPQTESIVCLLTGN